MQKLPWTVFVVCVLLTAVLSQAQLRGVVTEASGGPITGAWVYGIGMKRPRVVTQPDGSFVLNYSPRVIHVFKPGYRPFSRIVLVDAKALNLVIEKTTSTEWSIPGCATDNQFFGEHWKFKLETDAKPRKIGQSVDDSGILD